MDESNQRESREESRDTPEPSGASREQRRRSRSRGSESTRTRSRSASRPRSRSGSQVVRHFTVSENNVPRPATLVIDPPTHDDADAETEQTVNHEVEQIMDNNAEISMTEDEANLDDLTYEVQDLSRDTSQPQLAIRSRSQDGLAKLLEHQIHHQEKQRVQAEKQMRQQQERFEQAMQLERGRAERMQSRFLDALADMGLGGRRQSFSAEETPLHPEEHHPPAHLYDGVVDPNDMSEDQREEAGLLPVLKSVAAAQRVEFDPRQRHLRGHALADLTRNAGGQQIERALQYERNHVRRVAQEPFLEQLSRYELFNEAGLPATLGPIVFNEVPEGSRKVMSQRDFTELLKRMRPRTLPSSPDMSFGIKVREICRTTDGLITRKQLTELILSCCTGQLSVDVRYTLMASDLNNALNEICRSFGKIPHRSDMEVNTLTKRITAKNFISDMQRFHTNQLQLREADGRDLTDADTDIIELSKGQLPAPLVRFAVDLVGRYRERKTGPPLTWYHYRDALVKHAREKQLFPGTSDIYAVEAEADGGGEETSTRTPTIKAVGAASADESKDKEILRVVGRITEQTRKVIDQMAKDAKNQNKANANLIKNIHDANKFNHQQIFQPQRFGYPTPSDFGNGGHANGGNYGTFHGGLGGHNRANARGQNVGQGERNEASLQPLAVGTPEHKRIARAWDNHTKIPVKFSFAFKEGAHNKGRALGRGRLKEVDPEHASRHRWHPSYPNYYYLDGTRYTGPVFMTSRNGREALAYNCLAWASEHCFRCGNSHCGHKARSCPYATSTASWLFCERCRAGFHLIRDCKCFVEPDNKGLHQGN